jgi:hypothetical protein
MHRRQSHEAQTAAIAAVVPGKIRLIIGYRER